MKRAISIISIHCLPATLFLAYVLSMGEEYFAPIYLMSAAAFLLSSIALATYNLRHYAEFIEAPQAKLFFSMLFSWLVALFLLGFLNLTPLCVGQDNGDGVNTFQDCTINTVAGGTLYTIGMLFLILLVTMVAGWIIQTRSGASQLQGERSADEH
jgi:hypothetical protein